MEGEGLNSQQLADFVGKCSPVARVQLIGARRRLADLETQWTVVVCIALQSQSVEISTATEVGYLKLVVEAAGYLVLY